MFIVVDFYTIFILDIIDWIVDNLIDSTRNRRVVMKKLREMHLLVNYKGPKNAVTKGSGKEWGENEEEQLRELYEHFKDAMGRF